MSLTDYLKENAEVTLEALPEDEAPEGHFASGDDEWDRKTCAAIREQAEYSEWAWFTAKVTVRLLGFEGTDYLGCCSCKDEENFRSDGYFEDMQAEALRDLEAQILENLFEIQALGAQL